MAKPVDHELRRRQIAGAVWRLASRCGLEQVTLRQVAAEAGVSMRLVQYYFGKRHDLLVKALEILNSDATEYAKRRIAAEQASTPRDILRGVLAEMLPLDEQRRTRFLVRLAYFVRSLSDDDLIRTFRDSPPALEKVVADLIVSGQNSGLIAAHLDPQFEAALLLSSVDGLQTSIILGNRTSDEALALIDHQLDRLFDGLVG